MIWSLALANVMGAGICLLLAIPISRLTQIPFQKLAPFMIALICFAAFQATRDLADLVALLVLGVLGVLMKRFGWPRPALLIGFVLAPQAETYFYQAVQFYGWSMTLRPGVVIIALMTLVSVYFGLRNRVDDTGDTTTAAASGEVMATRGARMPQIGFALLVVLLLAFALNDALRHSFLGAVFPMAVAGVGLLFLAPLMVQLWQGRPGHPAHFDAEKTGDHVGQPGIGGLWGGLIWVGGLVAATALIGFYASMIGFFVFFLRKRAKTSWIVTLLMTVMASGFILGLAYALSLNFPYGYIQNVYDLPWPFR